MFDARIITGCWEDGIIELSGMPEDFILSNRTVVVAEKKEITKLRSENKELKEYLMKKLDDQPRTKDGVTVTDGMELFGAKIKEPIMSLMAETRAYYVDSDGAHVSDSVGEYFSTQEAFDQSTEGR